MSATAARRSKTADAPLELRLREIPPEDVFEPFRRDLRTLGLDLERFESRMGRLLDLGPALSLPPLLVEGTFGPVDLEDAGSQYLVRVELPGSRKEEVTVNLQDQALEIRTEATRTEETARKNFVYRGRASSSRHRRVVFPTAVVPERAIAQLENGVLTVTVPKGRPDKERKVPVT